MAFYISQVEFTDNETGKRTKEKYMSKSESTEEANIRIHEYFVDGSDFEILSVTKQAISEFIGEYFDDKPYYLGVVEFSDADTGKKSKMKYITQADTAEKAYVKIFQHFDGMMSEFEILSVTKQPIKAFILNDDTKVENIEEE